MDQTRCVFIALLSYTGTIWLPTHRSLLREIVALNAAGWGVIEESLMGCSYIHSARGQMVSLFLQSDATDLVYVDWDMAWDPGALARLLSHDVDVVAGDYPGRKDPIRYHARFLKRDDGSWNDDIRPDGLIEMAGAATGFMRIRRNVIERMVEAYPDLIFEDNDQAIKLCYLFFGHLKNGRHLLSDDYSFCDLWREIGGKVYIDTKIALGHIGFKTFAGEYEKWLLPSLKVRGPH
jgi:hypothetical protein